MNNEKVARAQGMGRRSAAHRAQDASGSSLLSCRRSRWHTTKLVKGVFALLVLTSTLMLMGCYGDDDDSETLDLTGERTSDPQNVMPLVNGKAITFSGGVMNATGPAVLSVADITTCNPTPTPGGCSGTFTLDGADDLSAEGGTDGVDSCFFFFDTVNSEFNQGQEIDCFTCDLEVVGNCVVETGETTTCQVRWILAGTPDATPGDPGVATSEPFNVTATLDKDGNLVIDGVVINMD